MTYHFFAVDFEDSLSEPFNKFTIFLSFHFKYGIIKLNKITVTAFCKNSKIVSSDF